MNLYAFTYLAYLSITIGVTYWVGRLLFTNGRVFLLDIFHQNAALAEAVNRLLLAGFYLVNIGYICWTMYEYQAIDAVPQVVELLSRKVGAIVLLLGGMHFLNMFTLFRLRRRALDEAAERTPAAA